MYCANTSGYVAYCGIQIHLPSPTSSIENWKEEKPHTNGNKFTQIVYILWIWIYLDIIRKATKSLSDKELLKVCFPSRLFISSLFSVHAFSLQASSIYDGSSSRWNNRHAIHFVYRYVSCWEIEKDEMSYFTFCDFNGI